MNGHGLLVFFVSSTLLSVAACSGAATEDAGSSRDAIEQQPVDLEIEETITRTVAPGADHEMSAVFVDRDRAVGLSFSGPTKLHARIDWVSKVNASTGSITIEKPGTSWVSFENGGDIRLTIHNLGKESLRVEKRGVLVRKDFTGVLVENWAEPIAGRRLTTASGKEVVCFTNVGCDVRCSPNSKRVTGECVALPDGLPFIADGDQSRAIGAVGSCDFSCSR
jgi:hypothetical protein